MAVDPLRELERKLDRYIDTLPTKVGALAVEFYTKSFRRQGWLDERLERWPPRKKRRKKRGRRRERARAILIKKGTLQRSIRETGKGRRYVRVGTDVVYAKRHNEGEDMPKRQFMGESKALDKLIERMIENDLKRILR